MDFTLQFEECIYLSCGQPYAYEGVAYDGNAYYFTLSNAPCIHIYQKDFFIYGYLMKHVVIIPLFVMIL